MTNSIEEQIVSEYNETKYKTNYNGLYQKVVKRILDVLICLLILPFVLLITIPVAIIIKLEDGGPVFTVLCVSV